MGKISLACHLSRNRWVLPRTARKAGPFITISRQYGCQGFTVGLLVQEILNEQARPGQAWQVYHKEILTRLANETHLPEEFFATERLAGPKWVTDFFRSLSGQHIPSGFEIRWRVTTLLRGLAIAGHAILVGQGGYWATRDLSGGLAIRLEAPYDWRVRQIAPRTGIFSPGPRPPGPDRTPEELPEATARVPCQRQDPLRRNLRLFGLVAGADRPARGVPGAFQRAIVRIAAARARGRIPRPPVPCEPARR
ncbi:MAG: cytidylate kinase family protein [Planctomycetota bacterium]|nr:cytidylate kinase family protein [Planctomycetota bacterium]